MKASVKWLALFVTLTLSRDMQKITLTLLMILWKITLTLLIPDGYATCVDIRVFSAMFPCAALDRVLKHSSFFCSEIRVISVLIIRLIIPGIDKVNFTGIEILNHVSAEVHQLFAL